MFRIRTKAKRTAHYEYMTYTFPSRSGKLHRVRTIKKRCRVSGYFLSDIYRYATQGGCANELPF
jgi:hypothetical protein